MRLRIVAGCGLSLFLFDIVPITAQQRSFTCGQREQQIKALGEEVTKLTAQTQEKQSDCRVATPARHAEACGPYGEALTLQRKKERELKDLTEDPAWQACLAIYRNPNLNRTPDDRPGSGSPGYRSAGTSTSSSGPAGGQSGPGGGGSSGSGQQGGLGNAGTNSPSGAGGRIAQNNQIPSGGSSDFQQSSQKSHQRGGFRGGTRGGNRSGTSRTGTKMGGTRFGGPSHGSRMGSSHSHRSNSFRPHGGSRSSRGGGGRRR
jgi:hypothetical protein